MPNAVYMAAKKLREELAESPEGRLTLEQALDIARSMEVEEGKLSQVIGYGVTKDKNWWRRDLDELVLLSPPPSSVKVQPAPIVSDSAVGEIDIPEVASLDDPREQFYALALRIGVKHKSAAAAANYISDAFDLNDMEQVWFGLQQCTEITMSLRKRLFNSWVAHTKSDLSDALRDRVESTGSKGSLLATAMVAGGPGKVEASRPRKYLAINGKVMPLSPDSEDEGFSFMQATQIADMQAERLDRQRAGRDGNQKEGEGFAATAFKEIAATERERIRIDADKKGSGDNMTQWQMLLEAQGRETAAHIAAIQAETAARIEGIQKDVDHRAEISSKENAYNMEILTSKLEQLLSGPKESESPFGLLDKWVPGLGQKIANNLFNPPIPSPTSGVTLKLEGQEMPFEVFKELKKFENQEKMIDWGKNALGELIGAARDLTTAIQRKEARGGQVEQPPPPEGESSLIQCANGGCDTQLRVPAGATFMLCPNCKTPQTSDGRLLVPALPSAKSAGATTDVKSQEGVPSPVTGSGQEEKLREEKVLPEPEFYKENVVEEEVVVGL